MCHGAFGAGPPPKRTAAAVQSWLTTLLPRSISGALWAPELHASRSVRRLRAAGRAGGVRGAPTLAGTCYSQRGEQRVLHRNSRPKPLTQPEPLRRQSSTGRTPVSGGQDAQPHGEAAYASRSSVCPPRGPRWRWSGSSLLDRSRRLAAVRPVPCRSPQVEKELSDICSSILQLLDDHLIPTASSGESKVRAASAICCS